MDEAAERWYLEKLKESILSSISKTFNPNCNEYPWYGTWDSALQNAFAAYVQIEIAPQYSIITGQADNDNQDTKSFRIPDFCVVYRRVEYYKGDPVSSTLDVPANSVAILENRIILIVENKPINSNWTIEEVEDEFDAHEDQVIEQAKHAFSKSRQRNLHSILAVGHYWKLYTFERDQMSPLSNFADPDFVMQKNRMISTYDVSNAYTLSSHSDVLKDLSSELRDIHDDFS